MIGPRLVDLFKIDASVALQPVKGDPVRLSSFEMVAYVKHVRCPKKFRKQLGLSRVGHATWEAPPAPYQLPRLQELLDVRAAGVQSRLLDAPRGTLAAPAPARPWPSERFDLSGCHRVLADHHEPDVQIVAAQVVGEYGGGAHVAYLGRVLLPRPTRVRKAAATALGTIGGPEAVAVLLQALETSELPKVVREEALTALLDLVAGGWEAYQMGGERRAMAPDIRRRLEALRQAQGIGQAIAGALNAFD